MNQNHKMNSCYGTLHPEIIKTSQLLSSICQRTLTSPEIEQLAKFCLKIAVTYLRILERRGLRIRETQDESEFQGIASDCIADLFICDKNGNLIYFQRYFSSRLENNPTEEDPFLILRQLITKQVQQHLTKLYAQRDPEGAKLIRNVRLTANRFNELQLNKDVTGEYISISNPDLQGNIIIYRPDYAELQNVFSIIFRANISIDKLVYQVLAELSTHFECDVEVSIFDLVKLIHQFRAAVEKMETVQKAFDPLTTQKEIELKKKLDKIILSLNKKNAEKYVAKNKLNLDQGIAISKALKDMSNDALSGERLDENFTYLQKHWNLLTREEYFNSLRKTFEYFVRQFKDEVKKSIINNSE